MLGALGRERSGAEDLHVQQTQWKKRTFADAPEQGASRWPEATAHAKGCLGDLGSARIENQTRDLAMFNLAIVSNLWGCDLVSQRVEDISIAGASKTAPRSYRGKTARPVQFEITEPTRASLRDWLAVRPTDHGNSVFPRRVRNQPHLTARQYARIVHSWIERAEMDSCAHGTHSLRRTKAAIIYKQTGNLGAVQPRGAKSLIRDREGGPDGEFGSLGEAVRALSKVRSVSCRTGCPRVGIWRCRRSWARATCRWWRCRPE